MTQWSPELKVSTEWKEIFPKYITFSHAWLFATPQTIQFMEFSRPEYWSG